MRKKSLLLEEKLNMILVGESGVGKTSLLNQYSKGMFQNQVIATVGS
jgi:GTPase SAR1 family protein